MSKNDLEIMVNKSGCPKCGHSLFTRQGKKYTCMECDLSVEVSNDNLTKKEWSNIRMALNHYLCCADTDKAGRVRIRVIAIKIYGKDY